MIDGHRGWSNLLTLFDDVRMDNRSILIGPRAIHVHHSTSKTCSFFFFFFFFLGENCSFEKLGKYSIRFDQSRVCDSGTRRFDEARRVMQVFSFYVFSFYRVIDFFKLIRSNRKIE